MLWTFRWEDETCSLFHLCYLLLRVYKCVLSKPDFRTEARANTWSQTGNTGTVCEAWGWDYYYQDPAGSPFSPTLPNSFHLNSTSCQEPHTVGAQDLFSVFNMPISSSLVIWNPQLPKAELPQTVSLWFG